MPIYEYACHRCRKFVDIIVRRVTDEFEPRCPDCGGKKLTRMVSSFSFHQSLQSKLDQLDPKYDKMIDASNPDLSFDNLVKRYRLNEPMTSAETRKKMRDKDPGLIPHNK